ncbi:mRNA-decapping enzyme-like protein [Linum perenne]
MSQTGKLMPNLDQQSTKVLNLTVLQRMDPFIEEILITAAHVTFYEFNIDNSQWGRKDVEGSLFVVKRRNAQPRFQFIVMNRRNTENLVENLLGDFEYEIQVPYLLYRNPNQEVNGIWFYNPRECEDVANLFSRILNAYSKVPSKPIVPSNQSVSEFEELEAVPNISVIEGPLEPSPMTSVATEVPHESSFENFFSAAASIGNTAPSMAHSRQSYHPSSTVPSVANMTSTISSPSLTPQVLPLPLSSIPGSKAVHETHDSISAGNRIASLLKPSLFSMPSATSSSLMIPPVNSSLHTASAAAHNPPVSMQRSYGAPMLQPFPPPTPPPSLTPTTATSPLISRDKVRDALVKLVQDDQFIDMFYQALTKVHHT